MVGQSSDTDFRVCPKCLSTEYIRDYPAKGRDMCVKCGQSTVTVQLKAIGMDEWTPSDCPGCGEILSEQDTFFEDDAYDENDYLPFPRIMILKCKKCGTLTGYRLIDYSNKYGSEYYDDRSHSPLTVKIAHEEGEPVYSHSAYKRFEKKAETWKRQRKPIEECKSKLRLLVEHKSKEVTEAGIGNDTIEVVQRRILDFIEEEGPFTKRQLNTILAAALSLVQKSNQAYCIKGIRRKVTDSQLQNMFGVTRKTIRKWRERLRQYSIFPDMLIWIELTISGWKPMKRIDTVLIPTDIENLVDIDKPYRGRCGYSSHARGRPELLSKRITLADGSYSDLCQKCVYELARYLPTNFKGDNSIKQ